ncbi:HNH endonuclease signature motif containing protein [Nocardioides sp. Kera G14]|uniref:HNH endonuclease signature motif containing protein n=1 Tax=Nocardioides sp. Kera G14 TaxID=2884264 RepID=UPI001D108EDF|nr:HNH endonuclease signature motif containing protein [Nocardioides sp. Kera G14]UDY22983.1 HNH endonuclease [Nocardioides sp. Kera G14]
MRNRTWTELDLETAVLASSSLAQVIARLGLRAAGGNYATIRRAITAAGLDTSHFRGQAWSRGRSLGPRRRLEDYLSNRHRVGSHQLRLRLISEGVFEAKCNRCGLTEWLGRPIALELEHRDGNPDNNALENLELLCPNCHAQTSTYRGRNIKRA